MQSRIRGCAGATRSRAGAGRARSNGISARRLPSITRSRVGPVPRPPATASAVARRRTPRTRGRRRARPRGRGARARRIGPVAALGDAGLVDPLVAVPDVDEERLDRAAPRERAREIRVDRPRLAVGEHDEQPLPRRGREVVALGIAASASSASRGWRRRARAAAARSRSPSRPSSRRRSRRSSGRGAGGPGRSARGPRSGPGQLRSQLARRSPARARAASASPARRGEHRARDVDDDERLGIGPLAHRPGRLDDGLHRGESEQARDGDERERERERASGAAAARARARAQPAGSALAQRRARRAARARQREARRRAGSGSGRPLSSRCRSGPARRRGPARRPGSGRSAAACAASGRRSRISRFRFASRFDGSTSIALWNAPMPRARIWFASWLSRAEAADRQDAEEVQLLRLPARLALAAGLQRRLELRAAAQRVQLGRVIAPCPARPARRARTSCGGEVVARRRAGGRRAARQEAEVVPERAPHARRRLEADVVGVELAGHAQHVDGEEREHERGRHGEHRGDRSTHFRRLTGAPPAG